MRATILTLLGIILFFSGCKKEDRQNTNVVVEQNNSHNLSQKDMESLNYIDYALDEKAELIIQDWTEYLEIQDVINNVKIGDLSFFNDNEKAIRLLLKELKVNIPEEVKSESIEARLLVVETKLNKLKSLSNLSTTSKDELLASIKEFLVAFSNLNLQMNKKMEFDTMRIEKP